MVANKIDRKDEREVDEDAVNEFLAKNPRIKHLETSAKNSEGVSAAFDVIALASVENKVKEV